MDASGLWCIDPCSLHVFGCLRVYLITRICSSISTTCTHQLMLFDMNLLASNLNLVILPKLKLFIIIHLSESICPQFDCLLAQMKSGARPGKSSPGTARCQGRPGPRLLANAPSATDFYYFSICNLHHHFPSFSIQLQLQVPVTSLRPWQHQWWQRPWRRQRSRSHRWHRWQPRLRRRPRWWSCRSKRLAAPCSCRKQHSFVEDFAVQMWQSGVQSDTNVVQKWYTSDTNVQHQWQWKRMDLLVPIIGYVRYVKLSNLFASKFAAGQMPLTRFEQKNRPSSEVQCGVRFQPRSQQTIWQRTETLNRFPVNRVWTLNTEFVLALKCAQEWWTCWVLSSY